MLRFVLLIFALFLPGELLAAEPMLPPSGDPWATRAVTTPALQAGAKIYAFCASCHLADGGGRPDGAIPRLAGQPAEIVAAKLESIRKGTTYLPVMAAFVNSLSPAEVKAVAAYIAALPAPQYLGHGDGKSLSQGEKSYAANCAACHGERGAGNVALRAPRLCGQHAGYTVRRIDEVVRNTRGDANAGMAALAKPLSASERAAVADYLSRGQCDGAAQP